MKEVEGGKGDTDLLKIHYYMGLTLYGYAINITM